MTLDDLRALAREFFEWPIAHNKSTVTLTSALLFAKHVLEMHEKSLEMHEKSLGTENSAGMDALRDAAQRQLDALGGYRREIGLLTGVPDEQPCDAEVAARAALEQEQEQEPNNPGECSECHAPVGSVCSDADCPGKAAPLITKPTDFVSLLREADEIVRAKPTWRRFIDGTPLSNDIAVWMAVFAQDVARRNAAAALKADAERYRYLLGHARRIDVDGWSISHMEQLSPRIDAAREGS